MKTFEVISRFSYMPHKSRYDKVILDGVRNKLQFNLI